MLRPARTSLWRIGLLSAGILVAAAGGVCADDGSPDQGAFIAVVVALALIVPLQFAVATILPAFTRCTQRAIACEFWTCAGWGGLVGVLVTTVAAIFGSAGGAARAVGIAIAIAAGVLALAGTVGVAKCIGDWAFQRWGEVASGPVSVLAGSVVWAFGAVVPIVGWLGAVLSLFAGLGAAVLVVLNPRVFDQRADEKPAAGPAPAQRPLEKLSVIVPVYNEQSTVREVIERVLSLPMPLELIVVDDGSTDGTPEILREEGEDEVVRVYTSPVNFGKGAAIRNGLSFVTGDVVIIQDADLELDPEEYPRLLEPILAGRTNAVYGSRFLQQSPAVPWRTRVANRLLALWCNALYRSRLTDVSTAYKVFRAETIERIPFRSVGFEFCAEVTAKLLRSGEQIEEVPVGFHPRTRAEGKKLNYLTDGLRVAWWLFWLRFARIPDREQSDS